MLVGISGKAGSGKDTVADLLVKEFSFVKVGLADPLKRIVRDVFCFTEEQLWGASQFRNEPDRRYPRNDRYVFPEAPFGSIWYPIGRGARTLISEDDLELVSQHKWCINKKEAGKKTSYVRLMDDSKKLHQLLMGEAPEGHVIDHINGDGLDNRRENLRFCTHGENHANESKRQGGSSVFKGVGYDASREKWSAKLMVNGQTRNLGRFDREVDAARAYDDAALAVFGKHARLNTDLFLTPRYALQRLGTQWGRDCTPNIWVDYAVRVANQLDRGGYAYDSKRGLFPTSSTSFMQPNTNVVIPDVRFKNEVDGLKRGGAVLIRVKRPGAGLVGAAATHASEAEQDEIPDSAFDTVLDNTGTIEDLHWKVKQLFNSWGK